MTQNLLKTQNSDGNIHNKKTSTAKLVLGALGVVYGDIGTSPLYALKECFHNSATPLNQDNLFGVISLIFWSLVFIVTIKYLLIVMKADNHGEGGILALTVFANKSGKCSHRFFKTLQDKKIFILCLGLFGSALIYGDGIITPAISVLSALEGLAIATPHFQNYILPIAFLILTCLFWVQKNGTNTLGIFFGPIVILWFLTLATLGISNIVLYPKIFLALNPLYGIEFIINNGLLTLHALGAIFLAVTGAEALYADMGHFGKKPIKIGWFFLVFPALSLNYFGQGALLIVNPETINNPFYLMAPSWGLVPLVVLATLTTIIASQALISGAFSLTGQAIALGYMPRLNIYHTSHREKGQIYIPFINWSLYLGTIFLILTFKTSSNLAAAYGIAVSATMVITTVLVFFVAKDLWKWNTLVLVSFMTVFIGVDLIFFFANSVKFLDGGWFPLLMGSMIFLVMTTWIRGRDLLWNNLKIRSTPFKQYIEYLKKQPTITKIPNSVAIFMAKDADSTPPALIYNVKYNQVIQEKIIVLSFVTLDIPYVKDSNFKNHFEKIDQGFYRLIVHHGFMESVEVKNSMLEATTDNFITEEDIYKASYFIYKPIPVPTKNNGMALWREYLFSFLMQNSLRVTNFYKVPTEQVIEIGFQVEI